MRIPVNVATRLTNINKSKINNKSEGHFCILVKTERQKRDTKKNSKKKCW